MRTRIFTEEGLNPFNGGNCIYSWAMRVVPIVKLGTAAAKIFVRARLGDI